MSDRERIDFMYSVLGETRVDVAETKKNVEWIKTQIELLKLKVAVAGAVGGGIVSIGIALLSKHLGV